ncbi:hypothetical protein EYZ11_001057 [Aspergillus tanneri]|uniref:Uncharacterized protein n=1 Tax=Aspergillus tanneri TaxID=1220188 RepID=A0A4S3JVN9_9EURO|nr:hypothetical protein EYZ11_001057 [Aspergillus tanneri]
MYECITCSEDLYDTSAPENFAPSMHSASTGPPWDTRPRDSLVKHVPYDDEAEQHMRVNEDNLKMDSSTCDYNSAGFSKI